VVSKVGYWYHFFYDRGFMKKLRNKIYKLAMILLIIGLVSSCWPVNRGPGSNSGQGRGNGQQLRDGSGNGPCTW